MKAPLVALKICFLASLLCASVVLSVKLASGSVSSPPDRENLTDAAVNSDLLSVADEQSCSACPQDAIGGYRPNELFPACEQAIEQRLYTLVSAQFWSGEDAAFVCGLLMDGPPPDCVERPVDAVMLRVRAALACGFRLWTIRQGAAGDSESVELVGQTQILEAALAVGVADGDPRIRFTSLRAAFYAGAHLDDRTCGELLTLIFAATEDPDVRIAHDVLKHLNIASSTSARDWWRLP